MNDIKPPLWCDNCGGADKGEQVYTADSFETCFKWKCRLLKGKVISECVDWNEHHISPLRDCPLKDRTPKLTPKEKNTVNWKMRNLKLEKANKALRKDIALLRKKFKKIHEMSSS